jgi:hypothetical protein
MTAEASGDHSHDVAPEDIIIKFRDIVAARSRYFVDSIKRKYQAREILFGENLRSALTNDCSVFVSFVLEASLALSRRVLQETVATHSDVLSKILQQRIDGDYESAVQLTLAVLEGGGTKLGRLDERFGHTHDWDGEYSADLFADSLTQYVEEYLINFAERYGWEVGGDESEQLVSLANGLLDTSINIALATLMSAFKADDVQAVINSDGLGGRIQREYIIAMSKALGASARSQRRVPQQGE